MSVIELKTRPVEIVQTVIERLEMILEEARAGRISAVAIAVVTDNGATNCAWSETDDVGKLLASVARLQHKINVKIDETNEAS